MSTIKHTYNTAAAGFTLIELLVAMAVFSFMLMIVVSGFINVVRINDQAVASNVAQDNAKTAMDEVVRGVRNSAGAITPSPANRLCLAGAEGGKTIVYYLDTAAHKLFRSEGCRNSDPGWGTNVHQITSDDVNVQAFTTTVAAASPLLVKREVTISMTVASNNNTTTGAGAATKCGPTSRERTFCSVVTLTSGAVPR